MNGKPWLDAIENGGAVLGFYGWLEVAHVSVYFGSGIMELCSPMTIPIPLKARLSIHVAFQDWRCSWS